MPGKKMPFVDGRYPERQTAVTAAPVISQQPEPGRSYNRYRGDTLIFRIAVSTAGPGRAFLRTNVGHAATIRREIMAAVLHQRPPLGRDWYDIPMRPTGAGEYEIRVPLCETGHFEAKCYFFG